MKKRKNMLCMLAILLVLVLLYFGLDSWNESRAEAEEQAAKDAMIYVVSDDELEAIEYTDGSSSMKFVLEEDTWLYDSDRVIPMDQNAIEEMESTIVGLTAERKLENPDDLEDYGLTEPSYEIIYTADEEENTISVGNLNGSNYYVTVNDTGTVYVCTSEIIDILSFELTSFIQDDEVPTIGSGNLLKVEVTEDEKKTVFEEEDDLAQLAGGFGVLTLDSCADTHVTEKRLSEYGLDKKSRTTVTAAYKEPDTEEEKEFTVYIGDIVDEENQYVMVKDSLFVYQISKDVVENMIVVSEEET